MFPNKNLSKLTDRDFLEHLHKLWKERHCKCCQCKCEQCASFSDEESSSDEASSIDSTATLPEPAVKPPPLWPTPLCDCHREAVLAWDGERKEPGWVYQCSNWVDWTDRFFRWTGVDQCYYEVKYNDWLYELNQNRKIPEFFKPRENTSLNSFSQPPGWNPT